MERVHTRLTMELAGVEDDDGRRDECKHCEQEHQHGRYYLAYGGNVCAPRESQRSRGDMERETSLLPQEKLEKSTIRGGVQRAENGISVHEAAENR